jgi:uncharacterized membrane protein (DUF2068 family)
MTINEYLRWARKYPDQLPTVHQYADLLYEYSLRMRLDYDEARSIVGLWTNKMWAEWLTNK